MASHSPANVRRRTVLASMAAAGGTLAFPAIVSAQGYPSRPIKIVTLSGPGANGDILSRLLGKHLGELLGQPCIVENKPGAGGHISGEAVARSAPDGHTILFGAHAMWPMASILFPSLNYDPYADLAPAAFYYEGMHWLITNPQSGVKNLQDFIAMAKAKGTALNFGSAGSGHPLHLYTEQIQAGWGTKMTHVPYNGMTPAIQALMTNDIQFLVTGVSDTISHLKAGKVQALATTGPLIPDIAPAGTPHLEKLYPDLGYTGWVGVFVPRKTPQDIVMALNTAMNKLADSPAYQKDLLVGANVPMKGSPADMVKKMAQDKDQITRLVKAINLKV